MRTTIALVATLVCATPLFAGKYNQVLSIGDDAPSWDTLESATGEGIGSDSLTESKATVVVFTCNTCPYAEDVEARLVALNAWLADRDCRLIAINVNKVDGDRFEDMQARAKEVGFEFPYLYDPSQEIAKRFGATTTPEFFVLDGSWKVAYMGSLDDSPDGKQVKQQHVRNAIEGVLAGESVEEAETVPIGCRIRFERTRRRSRR